MCALFASEHANDRPVSNRHATRPVAQDTSWIAIVQHNYIYGASVGCDQPFAYNCYSELLCCASVVPKRAILDLAAALVHASHISHKNTSLHLVLHLPCVACRPVARPAKWDAVRAAMNKQPFTCFDSARQRSICPRKTTMLRLYSPVRILDHGDLHHGAL